MRQKLDLLVLDSKDHDKVAMSKSGNFESFTPYGYIPPEKINWTLYFGHIVTLGIYFKRNNIIF